MKHRICLTVALLFSRLHAAEPQWKQYPPRTPDVEPSIHYPSTFTVIKPQVPESDRMFLNARFRSPDGAVEFAVSAIYARRMEKTVEARTIKLPLLPGERITERTPSTRKIKSEDGDYQLYDEDITVEGPKNAYIRYFHLELSTSSLPGASSVLWEFKAANATARKVSQPAYRQFKKTLNLGED